MQQRIEDVWHILCGDCKAALEASELPPVKTRADDGSVLLLFPTIGANGTEWRLRRAQVEEWQGLFPTVDVLSECRAALAWIKASPERRKTVKGMPRFLVAWFTRSVDRRGASQTARTSASQRPEKRHWFEECQEMHGGTCDRQWNHEMRKRESA